jgi:putative N6-adenine-specific DNA methylase
LKPSRLQGFAVCPAGLETILAEELSAMPDFSDVKAGRGGATFMATAEAIARANLWARVPTRLLIQAGQFTLRHAKDILTGTTNIAWEDWFTIQETLRIDFTVGREPRLAEPLARNYATLLIKDGICDRFRLKTAERPSIDTQFPDIRVWAYLDQNLLTLYLDTSGEPLFKRGWRRSKGEAPLRENLAAALILLSGWDRQSPLLDPFCGSGTLLIEAMQQACGLPPGFHPRQPRTFSAEKFHPRSPMGQVNWSRLRQDAQRQIEAAQARAQEHRPPVMMGSDLDPQLIRVAQDNAARALPAEIAAAITWQQASFNEITPASGPGLWVTNPPYGKRLARPSDRHSDRPSDSAADVRAQTETNLDFERELGEVLKKKFSGWQAWILTDNLKLESAMRLKSARRIPVFNGDLDCRWMRFDMVSGSNREKLSVQADTPTTPHAD